MQGLQTRGTVLYRKWADTAVSCVQRNLEFKVVMFVLLNNLPHVSRSSVCYPGPDADVRDLLRLHALLFVAGLHAQLTPGTEFP